MTDDKPLNVEVAEALGCKLEARGRRFVTRWWCQCAGKTHGDPAFADDPSLCGMLAPYGEESPEGWACTGPLIVRYAITIGLVPLGWAARGGSYLPVQLAAVGVDPTPYLQQIGAVIAPSPCEAVARLIVVLHREGRLPKEGA